MIDVSFGSATMLENLSLILKATKEKFAQYEDSEFILSESFKATFKEYCASARLRDIKFNRYSAVGETKNGYCIYMPNQWFMIATYFVDLCKNLLEYKKIADELITLENFGFDLNSFKTTKEKNKQLINICTDLRNLKSDSKYWPNLVENLDKFYDSRDLSDEEKELEKSYMLNFFTDYESWGSDKNGKTVDRSDFFQTAILSLMHVLNDSQTEIAHLVYAYAVEPELQKVLHKIDAARETPHDSDSSTNSQQPSQELTPDEISDDLLISQDQLDALISLIQEKKNVILQGAPGVGKTFIAKRLAYLIMLRKGAITKSDADERIEMIQFHQNYSYEDFIRGFKPTEDGRFVLQDGVFYSFCEKARNDTNHNYVFIIDEINRGNLSKILGEMMMLIEKDHRGEELELTYRKSEDEPPFSVPKNVYILGMMNTADRSLAMIDYALRRRFSFYPLKPAFGTQRFDEMFKPLEGTMFNELIKKVIELNEAIKNDSSLTEGCCIGHSYFCDCIRFEGRELENRLQRIVKYDILPILEEYWFDDKEKYEKWEKDLLETVKPKKSSDEE